VARTPNPPAADGIGSVAWSPDGTSILASLFRGAFENTIEVLPAAGGSPKVLVGGPEVRGEPAPGAPDVGVLPVHGIALNNPLYSPDGSKIAYAEEVYSTTDTEDVVMTNADGSDPQILATSDMVGAISAALTSWTTAPQPAP